MTTWHKTRVFVDILVFGTRGRAQENRVDSNPVCSESSHVYEEGPQSFRCACWRDVDLWRKLVQVVTAKGDRDWTGDRTNLLKLPSSSS